MDGVINLLKPAGMTSSDAVMALRRLLGVRKIGHTGTLDPDAAGVLPVCIGKATRLFDYLMEHDKVYIGEVTLGAQTDTQDAAGQIVAQTGGRLPCGQFKALLPRFLGEIEQRPSAYSAIKIGGKRAYDLARKGAVVEIPSRRVRIDQIELLRCWEDRRYLLRVACSRGTYIRTLAADLGTAAGCGAYLSFLLRTRSGRFCIEDAVTLEEVDAAVKNGSMEDILLPMDYGVANFPAAVVAPKWKRRLQSGAKIDPAWLERPIENAATVRVYCDGEFYGMARPDTGKEKLWRFGAMLWSGGGEACV
ncbi:tRNA pseudouridine(55) synthase TruB [Christensenellaceae bacterium NSJ-44]|uniref:tRNA pseudouridine synthase B n=1 Tax=Luoshenia tenuis TaxID=2763654 RepID=A0A926D091_9FIRM|nr:MULTISPECIES: tRNA pseudouridine(55) synthase TruB [Clostridia]MBC8529006.1 tRNA pseudouridine(55) synthase TruB [Luoshenia tenuis]